MNPCCRIHRMSSMRVVWAYFTCKMLPGVRRLFCHRKDHPPCVCVCVQYTLLVKDGGADAPLAHTFTSIALAMSTPVTSTSSHHNPTYLARLPLNRSHHHGIIVNYTARHLGVKETKMLACASSLPLSLVWLASSPSFLFSLSLSLPLCLSSSLPLFLSSTLPPFLSCFRALTAHYPTPLLSFLMCAHPAHTKRAARTNSPEKRHEPRPVHQRRGHGVCVLCALPTEGL